MSESAGPAKEVQAPPKFSLPKVAENPAGWGPSALPEQFKDIPYQPFSKSDRLGKAADAFTGAPFQTRRNNRYGSQYAGGQDLFGYYHDDESAFQLVDTVKTQRQLFRTRKWQSRSNKRDVNRARDERRTAGMQTLSKGQKARERDRERKWQRKNAGRRDRIQLKQREPSVEVRPSWRVMEEIEFSRLTKLGIDVDDPTDLAVSGAVESYDRVYDKVNTKTPRPLVTSRRSFHHETTTDDQMIRKLVGEGNVFATDAILATLMTAPRSIYSWDIVVERRKGKLFFDKREDSEIDMPSVNETANEPPQEDVDHINSPSNLAREAAKINQDFSQQVLRRGDVHRMPDATLPFAPDAGEELASASYRYRKWQLSDKLTLIARTEHDALLEKDEFVTIRALNEWDPKASGGMEWRQRLDTQRGAVFATELKNNSCKLSKWTVTSLLSGSSSLRLGYSNASASYKASFVSRKHPADPTVHEILGTQAHKPKEFASQISLSLANCWGIVKYICDILMRMEEDGKYVILKDPMKGIIRIYKVPDESFEDDEDAQDSDGDGFGEGSLFE